MNTLIPRPKKLADISPRSWEHPADNAALGILKNTGGLAELITMIVGGTTEKSIRLLHVSGSVKVTPSQFPRVKQLLDRVVDVMDWPSTPDVFVTNNPFFNAGVIGVKEPFIVLNSALLKTLDDEELCCAIGHEMGHIMSGHNVYTTVLWVLLQFSLGALPVAGLLVKPLVLALREWERKSELTADRAALLASQNEQASYDVLMKMAGGGDLSQMNVNDFFQQAWEYETQKGLLDGIFKTLNTAGAAHPFAVVRLQELHTWAVSGEYKAILDGSYIKRSDSKASTADDLKEGFQHYKTALQDGADPLVKAARDVGGKIGDAIGKTTEGIKDKLKDILKNP
jgi:Zn-dependent protease with chaperone function